MGRIPHDFWLRSPVIQKKKTPKKGIPLPCACATGLGDLARTFSISFPDKVYLYRVLLPPVWGTLLERSPARSRTIRTYSWASSSYIVWDKNGGSTSRGRAPTPPLFYSIYLHHNSPSIAVGCLADGAVVSTLLSLGRSGFPAQNKAYYDTRHTSYDAKRNPRPYYTHSNTSRHQLPPPRLRPSSNTQHKKAQTHNNNKHIYIHVY